MWSYHIFKPILDFILSLMVIIIIWPLFLVIPLIIKLTSKGPVFFKQKRIGKHKKEFYILKFRTMRIDTPESMPTHLLENPDSYITKFGRLLRKSSLDELPQIINILKGEMSIVGPRPALWNQYDLLQERDKYGANDTLPGLTGLAQINGRDDLPISSKAKLDGDYVKNINFFTDIMILIKTFGNVLTAQGIAEGTGKGDKGSNKQILNNNDKLQYRK